MTPTLLFLLLLSGNPQVPGQETPTVPSAVSDYQLGPGDRVAISVSGVRAFDLTSQVSNSGRLRVPYLGILFVAGKTAAEVEREIASAMRERQLVTDAAVRVHIEEYRAQAVYVIGDFTTPGQFSLTGELYLMDLVAKAGGVRANADHTLFLYRRNSPKPAVEARVVFADGGAHAADRPLALPNAPRAEGLPVPPTQDEQVIRIDLRDLRSGARPELNLRMQPGDVVYAPRRRPLTIYIIGDVKVPGAYTLPSEGTITAAQAVIYAGGPLSTAKTGKAFLMRHDAQGVRQAIPVDFRAVIAGKQQDIPVQPDDIIFIPNSAARTMGVAFLNLVPELIRQFAIF
jgi:protein involved in polysaccharide export with SLBB domain